jgi:hypothetical protein
VYSFNIGAPKYIRKILKDMKIKVIFGTFHPTAVEYTFFSTTSGTAFIVDSML